MGARGMGGGGGGVLGKGLKAERGGVAGGAGA